MKRRFFLIAAVSVCCSVLVISAANTASAAGFALIEQSVSGLGTAYSGGAAIAEDASTIYYNPAGLTRLNGTQVIGGVHIIMPSAKFHNEGSTHVTGSLLRGGDGGNAGETVPIPNLYFSARLTDQTAIGLGINVPFGLETEYDSDWVGRYHAIKSDLKTVNINPSIALKLTDGLSAGAGLNAQYAKATLTNAIDFGSFLGMPQGADGSVKLSGDSWGFGFNFGLLYEFSPQTRAGIAYRSKVKQKLTGDAEFSGVPAPIALGSPAFKNCAISAAIDLPATASASIVHQFSTQWTVMADITWTQWSSFDELRIKFSNPAQPDAVVTTNWRDTYRYSIGAQFAPDNRWTFKTGLAYDQTPIRSADYRTPRIPDNSRYWTTLGVKYSVSSKVRIDAGYAHLFVRDPKVDKAAVGEDASRGALKGYWDANVNISSIQLTLLF
jgi:long-chain fatty acid transport protein